jgi:hypothetical protein
MRSPRKSRQISIPSRSLLPRGNLQFNHLLVKDDEPLLFHPGLALNAGGIRRSHLKAHLLSELRHISFTYFESGECGVAQIDGWAAAPQGR